MLAFSLNAQEIALEKGKIYNLEKEHIRKARFGQILLVRADANSAHQYVFINGVKVDSLLPYPGHKGIYSFVLGQMFESAKSFDKVLLFNDAAKVNINLTIDETICDEGFTLILNPQQLQMRRIISIVAILLILIITVIIARSGFKILRDTGTSYIRAPFSLARSQMAFWTLVIIVSFLAVWWNTTNMLEISSNVLALLGISAGTTIGGHLIDNDDLANGDITARHQDVDGKNNFLMNILSDQNGLSIHRLQNVLFTVAIGGYVLYKACVEYEMPELDGNLMILMGISSSTYLIVKKGENKAFQDTAVG